MSTIKKLTKKMLHNYEQLEAGKISIAKAKTLNESANIIIRLALMQLAHTAQADPQPKIGVTNDVTIFLEENNNPNP